MAESPAVEAGGLGRDYGQTRALDAMDLVVGRGTLVGLAGPNGAGKTTAMLLLSTLLTPTRGSARLFGHDVVRERRAARRRLGLVFQESSIDGLLTVRENLMFAAGLMGLSGASAKGAVAEAIARTGLVDHASRPARHLSGGWRRLADLARATLHRPDLLILDEPTVGLDPEHRDRVWSMLEAERRERGTTVVFSTHYLAEADTCDRVIMLAQGRVVASDTPTALRAAVGEEVVEIEGADTGDAAGALGRIAEVRIAIRTERGIRIGVSGTTGGLTAVARAVPQLTRVAVRPATLEDVYFARTQGAARRDPQPESRR